MDSKNVKYIMRHIPTSYYFKLRHLYNEEAFLGGNFVDTKNFEIIVAMLYRPTIISGV